PRPSSHSPTPPPVDTNLNPATNLGVAVDGDPPHSEHQTDLNSWDREEFDLPDCHSPPPSDNHGPQEPPVDPNVCFIRPGDKLFHYYHPKLTIKSSWPCNKCGEFLAPDTPPLVKVNNPDDWSLYQDQLQFEMAKFL
ncbi:hypothetical protein PAXRUDRAFT_60970, partial [Paxillus rubicundulus Ve08.2h10]